MKVVILHSRENVDSSFCVTSPTVVSPVKRGNSNPASSYQVNM